MSAYWCVHWARIDSKEWLLRIMIRYLRCFFEGTQADRTIFSSLAPPYILFCVSTKCMSLHRVNPNARTPRRSARIICKQIDGIRKCGKPKVSQERILRVLLSVRCMFWWATLVWSENQNTPDYAISDAQVVWKLKAGNEHNGGITHFVKKRLSYIHFIELYPPVFQ